MPFIANLSNAPRKFDLCKNANRSVKVLDAVIFVVKHKLDAGSFYVLRTMIEPVTLRIRLSKVQICG